MSFGHAVCTLFQLVSRPASILQLRRQFIQYTTGYRVKRLGRFLLDLKGALGKDKMRLIKEFREGFRAILEAVQPLRKPLAL